MTDQTRPAAPSPLSQIPADPSNGVQAGAGTHDLLEGLDPEARAVMREAQALERSGKLDGAAIARVDARLQALADARDRELQARLERIRVGDDVDDAPPKGWVLPKVWRIPFLVVLLLVLGSPILEMTLGQGFLWSGGAAYGAALPVLLLVLLAVFAVVLYRHERSAHLLRASYPTWFVRWLFMYPLMVVFCTAMVAFAPWGWAAALGWATGTPSRVDVRVSSIGALSPGSGGCDQSARLEFQGAHASICLEGRLAGKMPYPGEMMAVSGRVSRLGLYVERVHGK